MRDEDITIEADGSEEIGAGEEGTEAVEEGAAGKLAKAKKELEIARREKQEYLDGWQRAKADYVNALKRFEAEQSVAMGKGTAKAAKAFIPVMDSLIRAQAAGAIPESFAGIAKQLETAARELGLSQLGTVGETFDPSLHEALGTDAASSAAEDDTVSAVLEAGWRTDESVLRPAKVRVKHFEA